MVLGRDENGDGHPAPRKDPTVLDVVFLTRTADGLIRIIDAGQDLDGTGLGSLKITAQILISDDLDVVRGSLESGTSAAVIAYEDRRTRRLAGVIEAAGGTVSLHVQVRSAWARAGPSVAEPHAPNDVTPAG